MYRHGTFWQQQKEREDNPHNSIRDPGPLHQALVKGLGAARLALAPLDLRLPQALREEPGRRHKVVGAVVDAQLLVGLDRNLGVERQEVDARPPLRLLPDPVAVGLALVVDEGDVAAVPVPLE